MKRPELANKVYERVLLNSPLHPYAQIQFALNLDSLDRTDEAKARLEKLTAANPGDLEAIMALGNVLRGRKQFAECADVYSKGIDTITKPEKSNWVIYCFRGICFERAKQWAKAEADLKKSLELFPDQPHVLKPFRYVLTDPPQFDISNPALAGGERMQFDQLNRRDFIPLLGGAAISWPPVQRTNGSEDDAAPMDFRCLRS